MGKHQNAVKTGSPETDGRGRKRSREDDPDYDHCNDTGDHEKKRQKLKEKAGRESVNKMKRAMALVDEHIGVEIKETSLSFDQMDEFSQDLKHILERSRTSIIASYYNQGAETTDNRQPFIHPTTKKHLGKAPRYPQCSAASTRSDTPAVASTSQPIASSHTTAMVSTPSCPAWQQTSQNRGRQCAKRIIIVGNISQCYAKRDTNDRATHKWKVYVRGPETQPDISAFVNEVVFCLDPSYKPNDVVKVSKPPFHLTKRGWGEFRIRCHIIFQDSRNRSIDIHHDISLDRKYTGTNVQGNETRVHIELESILADQAMQPKALTYPNASSTPATALSTTTSTHETTVEENIPKQNSSNNATTKETTTSHVHENAAALTTTASSDQAGLTHLPIKTELVGKTGLQHTNTLNSLSSTSSLQTVQVQGEVTKNAELKSNEGGLKTAEAVQSSTATVLKSAEIAQKTDLQKPGAIVGQSLVNSTLPKVSPDQQVYLKCLNSAGKTILIPQSMLIKQDKSKLGQSVKVGQSTKVGQPTKVGQSTKVGQPTNVGQSLKVGQSTSPTSKASSLLPSPQENKLQAGMTYIISGGQLTPTTSTTSANSLLSQSGVSQSTTTTASLPPGLLAALQKAHMAGNLITSATSTTSANSLLSQSRCSSSTSTTTTASVSPALLAALQKAHMAGNVIAFSSAPSATSSSGVSPQMLGAIQKVNTGSSTSSTVTTTSGSSMIPPHVLGAMQKIMQPGQKVPEQSKAAVVAANKAGETQQQQGSIAGGTNSQTQQASFVSPPSPVSLASPKGLVRTPQPRSAVSSPQLLGTLPMNIRAGSLVGTQRVRAAGPGGKGTPQGRLPAPGSQIIVRNNLGQMQILEILATPASTTSPSVPRSPTQLVTSGVRGPLPQGVRPVAVTTIAFPGQQQQGLQFVRAPGAGQRFAAPSQLMVSPKQVSSLNQQKSSSAASSPSHSPSHCPRSFLQPGATNVAGSVMVRGVRPQLQGGGLRLRTPSSSGPPRMAGISLLKPTATQTRALTAVSAVRPRNPASLITKGNNILTTAHTSGRMSLLSTASTRPSRLLGAFSQMRKKALKMKNMGEPKRVPKLNLTAKLMAKFAAKTSTMEARVVPKIKLSNFENVANIVRFVVHYHPLVAANMDRSHHPYCAPSMETFLGWSIFKRRAFEWMRAAAIRRDVKCILGGEDEFIPPHGTREPLWSKRDIVLWCRYHCHSPLDDLVASKLQKGNPSPWTSDYCSLSLPPDLDSMRSSELRNEDVDDEEEIDIDGVEEDTVPSGLRSPYKATMLEEEKRRRGEILPPTPEAEFVANTAKQIGVDMAPTELAPGVYGHTGSEMIFTAFKSVLEDVLLQSCAVLQQDGKAAEELTANEIYRALHAIPQCDFLTNKYMGVEPRFTAVRDSET